MCSPGERGWVIAGETWPGQLLSFLRDPINATRWRDVKARPHASSGVLQGLRHESAFPLVRNQPCAGATSRRAPCARRSRRGV